MTTSRAASRTTVTGTIDTVTRLSNTRNGNARFEVSLTLDNGAWIIGRTKGDSMFAITMPQSGRVRAEFHCPGGAEHGSLVFTDIEALSDAA